MSRLIDANALKNEVLFQQEHMWPEDLSYQIPKMIDKQTTIPAITLDWMREKMDGYAAKLKSTELAALVTVMQMWEQEGRT